MELSAVAIVLHVNHAKSSMNFTWPNGFVKICSSVLVAEWASGIWTGYYVGLPFSSTCEVRLGHVLEAELKYVPGGEICGEAQYMSLILLCSLVQRVLLLRHHFFFETNTSATSDEFQEWRKKRLTEIL
jgi:hypothetical protein